MLDDENRELDSEADEESAPASSEETTQSSSEDKQKNSISADLIRGHINTIILRTLSERDKYGYEIIEEIDKKSHGQYELKQPTLYSALKRLENQGYIKAYWKTDEISAGGRRKYFTLTDSGREITEKNRAEWEYSRTVIDSLISDQAFDFSKPAPTPVDFKILKKSTSRVPNLKAEDDEDEETEQETEKPDGEQAVGTSVEYSYAESLTSNLTLNDIQFTEQNKETEAKPEAEQQPAEQPTAPAVQDTVTEQAVTPEPAQEAVEPATQQVTEQSVPEQPAPLQEAQPTDTAEPQPEEPLTEESEQYKKLHENYLKLIDENYGKEEKQETPSAYGDNLDTEKLIYNNKPVTERDYKNLIDNMYSQTLKGRQAAQQPTYVQQADPAPAPAQNTYKPREPEIRITPAPAYKPHNDEAKRAENDGLKIYTSDRQVKTNGKYSKSYNIGETLLKCSGVVFAYLMLLFVITISCKSALGVSLAYPFIIFAIACCVVMICGVMALSGYGKNAVKPVTHGYIAISIVLTIIAIFIVCVVAILLNVNFGSAADVCKMMVIPSFVLLSAPIFTGVYYLFTK